MADIYHVLCTYFCMGKYFGHYTLERFFTPYEYFSDGLNKWWVSVAGISVLCGQPNDG